MLSIVNTKFKKTILIIIGSILVAAIVVILFISPITKYIIEKYDEKYTGRKITIGWVYLNPFTGYVHLSNVKIYEYKSDSLFIVIRGLSANFAISKILSGTININNFVFDRPMVRIIQNNRKFNFDDFSETFKSKQKPGQASKPIRFSFTNIKISDGHFYYFDRVTPVTFSIKNVNIQSTKGWSSNNDIISAKVSFLSENGTGGMNGNYSMNLKSLDYKLDVIVQKFDMKVIEQYMKGFSNYGTLSASLDADLKTNGCFKDAQNINIRGQLAISDFHFGKNRTNDYMSFKKIVLNINDVNPKEHRYFIDSLLLVQPYFKYEQYEFSNNLQTMFGKKGANISEAKANSAKFNLVLQIAEYIKALTRNVLLSDYKINKIAIYKGRFMYNDYSLSEKFAIEANPLTIVADSVNKNRKRVAITFTSGIQPYGNVFVNLSINPKDSGDFDMEYHLQKMAITMFNPYLIAYTSYPLNRGTLELKGTWHVRNGVIKSDNHLLVLDPRLTKRIKNTNSKWIPLPIIMFFIRERGNVIDYEIPISGNLNNPKFHFYDVITDILANIFVKPPTTPYRMQVKNIENEIEKTLTLTWEMQQNKLNSNQEEFVNKMADFLEHTPEATISVFPKLYAEKEMEYRLFFEAKKKYFIASKNKNDLFLNTDDSITVDKLSIKDAAFVKYLNTQVNDTMLFTMQDKCWRFVGLSIINSKISELHNARERMFLSYFKNSTTGGKIKVYNTENIVPYNGFSFYKIVYKGELPKSLLKAYQQMNEFNNEAPRKAFNEERKQNKGVH
jgi:hypothetical protein